MTAHVRAHARRCVQCADDVCDASPRTNHHSRYARCENSARVAPCPPSCRLLTAGCPDSPQRPRRKTARGQERDPRPHRWARGLCYFVGELKRQSSYTPTAPRYGIIPRRSAAVRVPAPPSSQRSAPHQAPDARAMRCADVGLPVRRGLSTPQQAAPLLPSVDSPSLHRLQL